MATFASLYEHVIQCVQAFISLEDCMILRKVNNFLKNTTTTNIRLRRLRYQKLQWGCVFNDLGDDFHVNEERLRSFTRMPEEARAPPKAYKFHSLQTFDFENGEEKALKGAVESLRTPPTERWKSDAEREKAMECYVPVYTSNTRTSQGHEGVYYYASVRCEKLGYARLRDGIEERVSLVSLAYSEGDFLSFLHFFATEAERFDPVVEGCPGLLTMAISLDVTLPEEPDVQPDWRLLVMKSLIVYGRSKINEPAHVSPYTEPIRLQIYAASGYRSLCREKGQKITRLEKFFSDLLPYRDPYDGDHGKFGIILASIKENEVVEELEAIKRLVRLYVNQIYRCCEEGLPQGEYIYSDYIMMCVKRPVLELIGRFPHIMEPLEEEVRVELRSGTKPYFELLNDLTEPRE